MRHYLIFEYAHQRSLAALMNIGKDCLIDCGPPLRKMVALLVDHVQN